MSCRIVKEHNIITTRKIIKLLPTQYRVMASKKREVLYSGGYGSGKSLLGCWAALRDASLPNNRVLIVRKTLASLRKSTLNTLKSILPQGSYEFNKTEGIITFHNKSEIYLMGCDNEERIKSTEFGFVFIDEGSELNEEEYSVIKYRNRLKAGSRRIIICTNPSNQDHFLYKRFYGDVKGKEQRESFTASSLDNIFLPQDYVQELNTLEGVRKDRCVNGLWINFDNMIFDMFDRNVHTKKLDPAAQYEDFVIGIDYGYSHYTGIVVCGINNKKITVVDEFYKNHILVREIVEAVKVFGKKYPNATYVYDPSAASMGAELENLDLHVLKANNDVAGGIDRIRDRLKIVDYEPDLMIGDNCVNLIREMENYSYVKGTEKPVKLGDDLVDPLRYCTNFVDDVKGSYIFPTFLDEEEYAEKNDGWEEVNGIGTHGGFR